MDIKGVKIKYEVYTPYGLVYVAKCNHPEKVFWVAYHHTYDPKRHSSPIGWMSAGDTKEDALFDLIIDMALLNNEQVASQDATKH